MNIKYILLFIIISFVSCTSDINQQRGEEDDIDFETFYIKFLSDSSYQLSHIQFPLRGRTSSSNSEIKWQKGDWQIHLAFDPVDSGFQSNFTKISDELIIETIILNKGGYGMERRFSKFGSDGWYLIYYADLHALEVVG